MANTSFSFDFVLNDAQEAAIDRINAEYEGKVDDPRVHKEYWMELLNAMRVFMEEGAEMIYGEVTGSLYGKD